MARVDSVEITCSAKHSHFCHPRPTDGGTAAAPAQLCRTAAALIATLATAAARVFLLSATMVISPLAGLGVLCSLYLASTVLHLCSGEGVLSLAHAYFR